MPPTTSSSPTPSGPETFAALRGSPDLVGLVRHAQDDARRSTKIDTWPRADGSRYAVVPNLGDHGPAFELVDMPHLPVPRSISARNVDGFVAAINDLAGARSNRGDLAMGRLVVYITEGRVLAYIDETDRRETVRLSLSFTPGFNLVRKGTPALPPGDLWRRLRIEAGGRVIPSTFLGQLKSVKGKSDRQSQVRTDVGRQSMDLSVLSEVLTEHGDLPETVMVAGLVYAELDQLGERAAQREFRITCAVDIDPARVEFSLIPLPGEAEQAITAADRFVAEYIRANVVPPCSVVCGASPSSG